MGGIHIFTLAGIPVQVSGWYLALLFYMGHNNPRLGMIWAACVTISILVHEFGHGLVARRLRLAPTIVLHGWGGLCGHSRAERDRDDVMIIAAGPAAGLVLGGLAWGAWRLIIPDLAPELLSKPNVHYAFESLIYINIWWSLINLLPLWPLDGGQLFRILMLHRCSSPATAERITHGVSLVFAIGGALLGYALLDSLFVVILSGFLAYENITRMGSSSASGPIRSNHAFGDSLLKEAKTALQSGDYREAARLCHQIRADSSVSDNNMRVIWEILGVANVELGDYEEAAYWLKRAPDTPAVLAARHKVSRGQDAGD